MSIIFSPHRMKIEDDWEFQFLGLQGRPKVIGLTGPTKTGKTIIAKRLATTHGYYFIGLGNFLRDISLELGNNSAMWHELGDTAIYLRMLKGQDILAKMALGRIRQLIPIHDKFVLDGLLHPSEIEFFASKCDFTLLGIVASDDVRISSTVRWSQCSEIEAKATIRLRDDFEQYRHDRHDHYAPHINNCLRLISNEKYLISVNGDITSETIHEPMDHIIRRLI